MDARYEIVQAADGGGERIGCLCFECVLYVAHIRTVALEPTFIGIAFRRRGEVRIRRQDGVVDRKGYCHPIHPIIGEALESVKDGRVADWVHGLVIVSDETHALSTIERYDGFMAEKGLCHG